MKQLLTAILVYIALFSCSAQDSFYDYIQLGELKVGYMDTIIYDSSIQYRQYNYDGPAPAFLQIWFPLGKSGPRSFLKLGDFKSETVPVELSEVYQNLQGHMDDSFVRDGIEYDILSDEPIDYGTMSTSDVLKLVKSIETKSVRSSLNTSMNYPVIVYHHGSQGLSYENSIMAEFFASKGYVFISANFHLPYANSIYGLLPYDLEKENKHDQSTAKSVIAYAKTITRNKNIFFIGHSWGAQEGWCFLHDSSYVNAFISMETTIEYKSDTIEIKDKWPYVYDAVRTQKNTFSIPILLLASVDDNINFDFFKGIGTTKMMYASYKSPFAHNSYTSFFLMRYFVRNQIPQPDSDALLSQIKGYSEHLNLMLGFLGAVRTEKKLESKRFEDSFNIE